MNINNPYEYHNDMLGVQARFIFYGEGAHPQSLQLIGERGLQQRVERDNIFRLRQRAPGHPTLLRWDTIPAMWQQMFVRSFGDPPKRVRRALFEQYFRMDSAAYDFYSSYRFPDGAPLNDTKIEEYALNASILNTMKELYDRRREYRRSLKDNARGVWDIICNEAIRFREVEPHTLPDTRLRDIFTRYRKEGYAALISKKHGNNNARVVTPEIELFINSLFADYTHKPNKAEVARQYEGFLNGYVEVINNATGELYSPGDFPRLSLSTVTSYISKWHNAIATERIRGGDRQLYMAKFKPYHSLLQPKFAGSIVSIDDRQPPFKYGDGRRVWFYNGIDVGSEAFVCWVHGESKEGIILDFYRQMVRNYAAWGLNLPAELECEMSLNSKFRDTLLKEGNMFQFVRIEANNARGKRIEAYYRPLRYEYEKRREGWLARPHALSEANQPGPKEVPVLPYEEIVQGCLRDIETWNNTEHSKIKGKTRWEVFLEMQHPNLRPTNYRAILPHLGHRTESSCNTGIIKLQRGEFLLGNDGIISVGLNLINLMKHVEGRNVEIYWLDDNQGHVMKAHVYVGGSFICEAIPKPAYNRAKIERTPQDDVNYGLMSQYVETIEGYRRRREQQVDKFTVIDNTPRTLNSLFTIDGVNHYAPPADDVEILPPADEFNQSLNGVLMQDKPARRATLRERY